MFDNKKQTDMKNSILFGFKPLLVIAVISLFTLNSCGSYQYVSTTDGIYDDDEPGYTVIEEVEETEASTPNYYGNYFKGKAIESEGIITEEEEIFTEVDSYESTSNNESSNAGWGENSSDVVINVYNNGWNNYGWNNPYSFYGPNLWGWNSYRGYNRYANGWNNWGWNNWACNIGFYGGWNFPNYGYGYGYNYGYYGNPYNSYGFNNYNRYGRNYAYNNYRRNSLNNSYFNRNSALNSRLSNSRLRRNTSNGTRVNSTPRTKNSSVRPRTNTSKPRTVRPRTNTSQPRSVRPRTSSPRSSTPRNNTYSSPRPRSNNSYSSPRTSSPRSSSTRSSSTRSTSRRPR